MQLQCSKQSMSGVGLAILGWGMGTKALCLPRGGSMFCLPESGSGLRGSPAEAATTAAADAAGVACPQWVPVHSTCSSPGNDWLNWARQRSKRKTQWDNAVALALWCVANDPGLCLGARTSMVLGAPPPSLAVVAMCRLLLLPTTRDKRCLLLLWVPCYCTNTFNLNQAYPWIMRRTIHPIPAARIPSVRLSLRPFFRNSSSFVMMMMIGRWPAGVHGF